MACDMINRAHLAGVSTCSAVWRHVAAALDASYQDQPPQHFVDEILDASTRNPNILAAPRDPTHTREVTAWLAEQWRLRGWKVPVEFQLDTPPFEDGSADLFYKTYIGWGRGASCPGITLMESSGGITRSTTGLTTWCGAGVLAEWVANYPAVVAGKRILELGAGVGFSAAVILTSASPEQPPPSSYIATDCHPHVLTLLQHNLELNLADPPFKRTYLEEFRSNVTHMVEHDLMTTTEEKEDEVLRWCPPATTTTDPEHTTLAVVQQGREQGRVGVMQVDWRCPPRLPDVDVVLAADVVYCRHLLKPLVQLVKSILRGNCRQKEQEQHEPETREDSSKRKSLDDGSFERKKCNSEEERLADEKAFDEPRDDDKTDMNPSGGREAYFACTRRNHETLNLFLQEVQRQGLHYALVYQASLDADTALFVYNETHLPIKVYRVTLPQEDDAHVT